MVRIPRVGRPTGAGKTVYEDRQYTEEERAFLQAIDRYKRQHRRPFPSWIEILDLLKGLGYRRGGDGDAGV